MLQDGKCRSLYRGFAAGYRARKRDIDRLAMLAEFGVDLICRCALNLDCGYIAIWIEQPYFARK